MTWYTKVPFLLTGDENPSVAAMQASARRQGLRLQFTVVEEAADDPTVAPNDLEQLVALHRAIRSSGGDLTRNVHNAIDDLRNLWDARLQQVQRQVQRLTVPTEETS